MLALEWLGSDYLKYNGEDSSTILSDAQYYPGSIADSIRHHFDHAYHTLTIWLNSDLVEWDLTATEFKKLLIRYLTRDKKKVNIVLPIDKLEDDFIDEFHTLKKLGANFYQSKLCNSKIVAQLESTI